MRLMRLIKSSNAVGFLITDGPRTSAAERTTLSGLSVLSCLKIIYALVAIQVSATSSYAQDAVAQFYRGKTVTMFIGSGAGGGYDAYARALTRHMGKYILGNPTMVPQNMPGAGSTNAAAYLYSMAAKDGTAMAALFPGSILAPLVTSTPIQHDPRKFIYIGSANSEVYSCIVHVDSPIKTYADAFTQEVIIGASAEGGSTRDLPTLDNNLLGTRFRIISGYEGTRALTLAFERKEIDGICGFSSLRSVAPQWITNKTVRYLAQHSVQGSPDLNKAGVPRTIEFAKSEEIRQALDLVYGQGVIGRPFVLPDGVPSERVEAVRSAFLSALADPALVSELTKMNLYIEPISGADAQSMVARWFAMPSQTIALAKKALVSP